MVMMQRLATAVVAVVGTTSVLFALSEPGQATSAGQAPKVFAPGVISLPDSHDDYLSLSPDGRSAVFTRLAPGYRGGTVYLADRVGASWANVRVAPFSGTHQDSRASFSPDGHRVVFASNRPGATGEGRGGLDLWQVARTASGWSDPTNLGSPVNTSTSESHPSLARSGAIYFVRSSDLWMAPALASGGWGNPVRLPDTVNSPQPDSHVFVDPAERFLLFAREVAGTGDDVYVSIRVGGAWSVAEPLGPVVNTTHYEYSAKIFGDVFYFTRNGQWSGGGPADILMMPVTQVPPLAKFSVGR